MMVWPGKNILIGRGSLINRLSLLVTQQLHEQPGLSFGDRSLYLWTVIHQPKSIREASLLCGLEWKSVEARYRKLEAAGWLRWLGTANGHERIRCPMAVIPAEIQVELAKLLERDYGHSQKKGEFLMKRHLDLWIRSDDFVENHRPDALISPLTKQSLELDRHYFKLRIAFEFNGSQHYGVTPLHGDQKAFDEQRARDLIKASLCKEAGIRLIIVTAEDLVPEAFKRLLPDVLPRYHVDEKGPYFAALARLSSYYAKKAAREQA
jgi:hypothetical protein